MIFSLLHPAARGRFRVGYQTALFMNLTAVLLLTACLQVSAAGFAQRVTLSEKNARLEKVFREIRKQTGYTFFYNARLLKEASPVSLQVANAPLQQVLELCFRDQPLTYSLVNQTVVIRAREKDPPQSASEGAAAPAFIEVRGRVTDAQTSLPVAGANITVKGAKTGVVSDDKGAFTITADPGAVLVVSYVGYDPREVTVRNGDLLTIALTVKAAPLESVVVTGYQTLKKESFTGATTTITGEQLKRTNPVNVLQAVQSFDPSFKLAENNILGSDPNRLPAVNVRGSTALPSGSEGVLDRNNLATNTNLPTFILDGFEVSLQKVYDLDINRIQSITLLKDAAATAIYGSRAANGVLVITTKPPKEGKLQLTYNYETNVAAPDLSGYDVLNGAEKLEYERLAGLYDSDKNEALSQDQLDELYYRKMRNVVGGVNTYWLSQPLRTAVGQKHSLFVEGGSTAIRYGVEMRYQTMPGVMKGSYRDRYSLGSHLTYNPSQRFSFRNILTVAHVKSGESPYGGFEQYVRMNPYYPMQDSTGRPMQEIDQWTNRNTPNRAVQTERVLNPLYNATLNSFNKGSYLEFIDAFSAEWNIVNGLRLRSLASLSRINSEYDGFISPLANDFYFYPASRLADRGRYNYSTVAETIFDGNATLTYNKGVGDHFFNIAAGTNVRSYLSDGKSFSAIGFTNDRFTNIGFANRYEENSSPGGNVNRDRLFGAFLGVNYSFNNKYLVDVSARADGSSKFGAEHRVAPFWAFGLGWNAHREDFLANTAVSLLRLRASTGLTGAVSFPPYLSKTTFSYYSDWYATGVGAVVNQYGNENLQWQRTRNYDIGMDLGFWKDRLTVSPRYYYKLTEGLLADIMLPPSTGFTSYKDNLGDMENYGFELNLKYDVIRSRDFTATFTANAFSSENKILRISNALKEYNDKADQEQVTDKYRSVPLLRFQEGQSLNTIYAVRSLGIDPENGKELFRKRNDSLTYVWNVRDIVPVGDYTPTAEGFLGANIAWRNFIFSASCYYRFGGDTYNQTLVDRVENADPRFNVDRRVLDERWKQPGDRAFFKNIADLGSSFASDRFVQKDNLLELRSVYLSYDFDKKLYRRLAMQNLRVAVTLNDIWRTSSIRMERGISYPYARNFNFSLQTSF
ncbi:MAG TPA: SusC/RagA family TonB-linked outer membrane protein [Chitinophagaceae bacterium]|nr:SusC/RagA family TonB-linked outer membrane protein [Chitinophagaceae bacterium]